MTIHTDTFPLVCQHIANSPQLTLSAKVIDNKIHIFLHGSHGPTFEGVDITQCLPASGIRETILTKELPIKINLIDNATFKHILERLAPKQPVLI